MQNLIHEVIRQTAEMPFNSSATKFNLNVKYEQDVTFEVTASGNAEVNGQSYTYETLVKINKDL